MPNTISQRTKTVIARQLIQEGNDYYPNREATPDSDGDYPIKNATATIWRLPVAKTTEDVSNLFKWKHGERVYGTHANSNIGMKNYIKDINNKYGKESNYYSNVVYVDTFAPIGEQL